MRLIALLLALGLPLGGHGQPTPSLFAFAAGPQARALLGARDDYVRATGELERSAKLRRADAVDGERFAAQMAEHALTWSDEERRLLEPLLTRLERFVSRTKWRRPASILMVKASDQLEEGLPHTRANAIVLPQSLLTSAGPVELAYVVAHEVFHVLSRTDAALREELYAAIGFRICAQVELPAALRRLRITNPDAVETRHAVRVRFRGRDAEVMPFIHLPAADIDPRAGFKTQLTVSWLLVERTEARCTVAPASQPVDPAELDGLYEQIGRNTEYIMHPEEILADNFAVLFLASERGTLPNLPSPDVLERIRGIMLSSSAGQRTSPPLSLAAAASP